MDPFGKYIQEPSTTSSCSVHIDVDRTRNPGGAMLARYDLLTQQHQSERAATRVDLSHYDGLLSAHLSGDGFLGAISPAEERP